MVDDKLAHFRIGPVQSFEQYCTEFLGLPACTPAATQDANETLEQSCNDYIQRESNHHTKNALLELDNRSGVNRWVAHRGGAGFRKEGVPHSRFSLTIWTQAQMAWMVYLVLTVWMRACFTADTAFSCLVQFSG